MTMKRQSGARGFTLIELLIVIGIIGFLASAILVAVDPVKRIQDARNAKRWSEVNAVLNAILNKQVDERKQFDGSTAVPILNGTKAQIIVSTDSGLASCNTSPPTCPGFTDGLYTGGAVTDCFANLNPPLSDTAVVSIEPKYIAEIPIDPGSGNPNAPTFSTTNTGYYINRNNERIEIGACWPDQSATIRVKR